MKITIINSTDKPYSQLDFDNKNDYSIINLKQLDIKYCLGCFECWYKTPGTCVQKGRYADSLKRNYQFRPDSFCV